MDSPIHAEDFHSGGATTLIFIVDGANAVISRRACKNPLGRGCVAGLFNICVQLLFVLGKLAGTTFPATTEIFGVDMEKII